MITTETLNPFVQGVQDMLYEGEMLTTIEGSTPGGFTQDDLAEIR